MAIWRTGSVRLRGNGQLTQPLVETATCGCRARAAPDPTLAEWRSGVPATTTTPSASPRSAATAGRTVPITAAVGRRGGSLSAGTPDAATSTGSYPSGSATRLSVSQAPAIEAAVAAAIPVKRMDR